MTEYIPPSIPIVAIVSPWTDPRRALAFLPILVAISLFAGCGTTKLQSATEQLVLSDAVDRSISRIDFRPLAGQKVFLDTTYIKAARNIDHFVNADYVISGLRQQIVAAGCLLQSAEAQADLIIEARIGTLGADDHRVTYGIPENNALASAVSVVSQGPSIPTLPEIAVAKREAREGAAKVAAFAYDRETRHAVWQSGTSRSTSTSRDTWVLGIGPFRQGSIRKETKFADGRLFSLFNRQPTPESTPLNDQRLVDYNNEHLFKSDWKFGEPVSQAETQIAEAPSDGATR